MLAFDPAYGSGSRGPAVEKLCFAANALECIEKSDVVVLATSWPEFNGITPAQWACSNERKPRTVIDCWRTVKFLRDQPGVDYLGLGLGEGFA